MITLKDILTKEELRTTNWLLKQTKSQFGYEDYLLFKKMATIVGFIYGLEGYRTYQSFIKNATWLVKHNRSTIETFAFNERVEETGDFFGIKIKFIKNATFEEVRAKMIKTREEKLKKYTK